MIFNLFKSKPSLKELIPKGFVDIHSHILPGIDDGAKNIEESLVLISELKKLGFSKIIGTPHTYPGLYNNTEISIKKSFKKIIDKNKDDIEIKYSSEYMLGDYLIPICKNKNLLCLKSNYVLVEMSYLSAPNNLEEIIFQICINGYIPVLAHPERYRFFINDFKKFYRLKKLGCEFQINLFSTTGYYGPDVLILTEKLLKNNLVNYTGTDLHNIRQLDQFNNKLEVKNIKELNKIIEKTKNIFG